MINADTRDRHSEGKPEQQRFRLAPAQVEMVVRLSLEGIRAENVLDVGVGTGVFATAFTECSLSVTGVDPDPDVLKAVRQNLRKIVLVNASPEQLPFEPASFDLVFLGLFLYKEKDPAKVLSEARRIARRRVVVLDWPYRADTIGPSIEKRLRPAQIRDIAGYSAYQSTERIELEHLDLYLLSI